MTRARLLASAVVAALLVGAVLVWGGQDPIRTISAAPAQPAPQPSSTAPPDFEALVASGTANPYSDEEVGLTEEALNHSTSTSTTTTSTPTSTTTTVATENKSTSPTTTSPAPATTSPPSTQPPETSPPTTAAGGYDAGAESDFVSRINSYRESNGGAPLSRDGSLDSYARSWAKTLAENGGLSHSDLGSLLPPWAAAGENVGMGGSVGSIFDALVSSSGHRANMLEDFTHMGVGVYRDSAGILWTAHVFTR